MDLILKSIATIVITTKKGNTKKNKLFLVFNIYSHPPIVYDKTKMPKKSSKVHSGGFRKVASKLHIKSAPFIAQFDALYINLAPTVLYFFLSPIMHFLLDKNTFITSDN